MSPQTMPILRAVLERIPHAAGCPRGTWPERACSCGLSADLERLLLEVAQPPGVELPPPAVRARPKPEIDPVWGFRVLAVVRDLLREWEGCCDRDPTPHMRSLMVLLRGAFDRAVRDGAST